MFKWLTRNDGARVARAKRRMASSRASVFVEFAMIVPVVALVCSALIEIVGLWDAEVMANHTAWTVGRIVMVRGSDGLVFSKDIDKKSKTGIIGSDMPDAIKEALKDVNDLFKNANDLINNRANIATIFLMSTCGIGYYGDTPGTALSKGFDTLCSAAVTALTDGVKGWIEGMADNISIPSFVGDGGTGAAAFVNKIVKTIVDKIVSVVISPIVDALAKLLEKAFNAILEKLDIDGAFAGDSTAARRARQLYGAAVRVALANSTIGKEVVTVKDMKSENFFFANNNTQAGFKHLAYPQVVDKGASSDGYFVKDYHGWPPNSQGLQMVHVEINWPYESGWLFPVVSTRMSAAESRKNRPVAKGHSMVFPQPNISNENLYSEGAAEFDAGSFTNTPPTDYKDLENEMKQYLKLVRFGMKYRIDDETLTVQYRHNYGFYYDEKDHIYHVVPGSGWYVPELLDLWGLNGNRVEFPVGGDYGICWSNLTDGISQTTGYYYYPYYYSHLYPDHPDHRDVESCFMGQKYHGRDYFYWEGLHYKYKMSSRNGNAGLGAWYDGNKKYTYANDKINLYNIPTNSYYYRDYGWGITDKIRNYDVFSSLYDKYTDKFKNAFTNFVSEDMLRERIGKFAARNGVNVGNIVKWQEGCSYEAWKTKDKKIHELATAAESGYPKIRKFIKDEIAELDAMINGTKKYEGDPDDPVVTEDDEELIEDPKTGVDKARAKWEKLKSQLKQKLAEVDDAVLALRESWTNYNATAQAFKSDRWKCVPDYFIETCFNLVIKKRDLGVFDENRVFSLPADVMAYNVYEKTEEMLACVEDYHAKLEDAYEKEVEYGALVGLKTAGDAKRKGKSLDELIDPAEETPKGDKPGSFAAGDDDAELIRDDYQHFSNGKWRWSNVP